MNNETWMNEALELAKQSIDTGGGPFGAVVVFNGEVVGRGQNRVTLQNDPTAHAEVQAIRDACNRLKTFDLSGCQIFTSCEPCPMCFSAIYWAHIHAVYFAGTHADAEKAGFDDAYIYNEIKLPIPQRSVLFEQVSAHKGFDPFAKWLSFDGKTHY
jgi:guanine deaminase